MEEGWGSWLVSSWGGEVTDQMGSGCLTGEDTETLGGLHLVEYLRPGGAPWGQFPFGSFLFVWGEGGLCLGSKFPL